MKEFPMYRTISGDRLRLDSYNLGYYVGVNLDTGASVSVWEEHVLNTDISKPGRPPEYYIERLDGITIYFKVRKASYGDLIVVYGNTISFKADIPLNLEDAVPATETEWNNAAQKVRQKLGI